MSEKNDYKTFKQNVITPHDRCDRVENLVLFGMPDTNLCIDGVEVWIEFKSPTEPKSPSTPLFGSNHKLTRAQANWMLRQRQALGRCWLLIATDRRWMLIDGKHADDVNKLTLGGLIARSEWCVSKPVKDKVKWRELRELLKR